MTDGKTDPAIVAMQIAEDRAECSRRLAEIKAGTLTVSRPENGALFADGAGAADAEQGGGEDANQFQDGDGELQNGEGGLHTGGGTPPADGFMVVPGAADPPRSDSFFAAHKTQFYFAAAVVALIILIQLLTKKKS